MSCCVPYCQASRRKNIKGLSFHEFPSDRNLCSKWLLAIARKDFIPNDKSNSSTVCSKHFKPDDFLQNLKHKRLKPGVVPSIFESYPDYLTRRAPMIQNKMKNPTSSRSRTNNAFTSSTKPTEVNPSENIFISKRNEVSALKLKNKRLCTSSTGKVEASPNLVSVRNKLVSALKLKSKTFDTPTTDGVELNPSKSILNCERNKVSVLKLKNKRSCTPSADEVEITNKKLCTSPTHLLQQCAFLVSERNEVAALKNKTLHTSSTDAKKLSHTESNLSSKKNEVDKLKLNTMHTLSTNALKLRLPENNLSSKKSEVSELKSKNKTLHTSSTDGIKLSLPEYILNSKKMEEVAALKLEIKRLHSELDKRDKALLDLQAKFDDTSEELKTIKDSIFLLLIK